MKTALLMGAIIAGLAVNSAQAQERHADGPRGEMEFSALDANSDGMLTPEDLAALQAERFATADTDGDGGLSEAELIARATQEASERAAARAERFATRMLERLDENEDGILQADELGDGTSRGMDRMFARFDTDEDGAISQEEFEAAKAAMEERRGDRMDRGGRDGHGPRDRG